MIMTNMRVRKAAIASMLAVLMMSTLPGCGGDNEGKTDAPPFGAPPTGFEGVFALPYEGEATAEAGLIQPGEVSAYSWDSDVKPNVLLWYDNADSSTNVCMNTADRQNESTQQGVNLSVECITEFYSRIKNVSTNYAGMDHFQVYTLSGSHFADLQEAGNNTVSWEQNQSFNPSMPEFYVRSLEMTAENSVNDGGPKYLGDKSYTVLSEGVLRQLYGQNGKISEDSFKNDVNVVFSDIADVDMTSMDLAEMIAARLKAARADGNDVSLYCVGVKLPYSGFISVPDQVHSLTGMTIYPQHYSPDVTRAYYFLITGPTAAAELYTRNLINSLGDKIHDNQNNTNGFAPQSMFLMDPAEEEDEGETAETDRMITIVPAADTGKSSKNNAKKNKKDSDAEADTTEAQTDAPAANPSDYRTFGFVPAEEADMLACFRGSDTGDFAKFAEKRGLNWKQYMSCVYLEKEGSVSYPAELLAQLRDTETKEIMGAKLYQAALEKTDKQGKEMSCTWLPVSAEDFNATGNLVSLQNEVYVKFNKLSPSETHAWMLEIDLADRIGEDPGKLVDPAFKGNGYTSSDIKNSSYFSALSLDTFAETIIRSRDERVTEKYYVLMILKHSPTTVKNTPGAKNRKDASSEEDTPEETAAE